MQKTIVWSETVLLAAGLFKLALLIAFFCSFLIVGSGPANSTDLQACEGKNLLVELEKTDPEQFASIMTEAADTENGRGLFWKIVKPGAPTSWLFGTMHMADPKIASIPSDVEDAINNAEVLAIETTEGLDPNSAAQTMASLSHLTILSNGTLRDLVNDELEDDLEAALIKRGVPMVLGDRLQPWLAATTIALPVCELQLKNQGAKVLDHVLADYAKGAEKEVVGLETMAEQFNALASLPQDYHVSALEETLSAGDIIVDLNTTMRQLYLDENIGAVFPMMKVFMPSSSNTQGLAKFRQALIKDRNLKMVERAVPKLNAHSTVIAVGALHLPGETGIVKLLREAGFEVTLAR